MDPELKQYLESMESRMDSKLDAMESRMDSKLDAMESRMDKKMDAMESRIGERVVTLVTGVKESLEHQINSGFEEMASRFDIQSTRLDRQAALIQTGSRWTNRMNDWAENVDVALDQKSQEITALRIRVDKLENGTKPA